MTTPVDPRETLAKALFERTMSALYVTSLTWDCTDQVHWRSEAEHLLATVVSLGYRPAHEVADAWDEGRKAQSEWYSELQALGFAGTKPILNPYRAVLPVTETPEEAQSGE